MTSLLASSEFDDESSDTVPDGHFPEVLPALPPGHTEECGEFQQLEREAQTLAITDLALRERATFLFNRAETRRKDLKDAKAAADKALKARIAETFKTDLQQIEALSFEIGLCDKISDYTRQKMNAWDREEIRRAQAKQAEQNKKIEDQNQAAAAKAEEKGLPAPMFKAPTIVQTAPAKVQTDSGTVSRKTFKNWTVKGGDMSGEQDEKKRKKALGLLTDKDPRLADVPKGKGLFLLNVELIDTLVEADQAPEGLVVFDDVDNEHRRKRK